jgi:hypothetical protein
VTWSLWSAALRRRASRLDLDEHLAGTSCGGVEFDEFQDTGRASDGGDLEFTPASHSGGLVLSDDVQGAQRPAELHQSATATQATDSNRCEAESPD